VYSLLNFNGTPEHVTTNTNYVENVNYNYNANNVNDRDSNINSNFEYVPVMVIRTRSNSIFSSEDEITTHDLMSITNDNMENYSKTHSATSYAYHDWNRYGILPLPAPLVMNPSLCNLCGVVDDDDAIHTEYYTGCIDENVGYRYCLKCKNKFEIVIKKRAEPIWELLNEGVTSYFWAPRTRRDSITNQRIYSGPYKYDKWKAISTYVSYVTDNTKGHPGIENTPFIYCVMISGDDDENGKISKLISLSDILKSNYNACKEGVYDSSYDPNVDDPVNTLQIPHDAKIMLHQ